MKKWKKTDWHDGSKELMETLHRSSIRQKKKGGVAWHVGEWRSRLLLYKTGTGTLEVKGRNRKGEDHRCKCRTRERETVQHFLAVPKIQKVERRTHSSGEENNWKGRMGKKSWKRTTVLYVWYWDYMEGETKQKEM